MTDRRKFKGAGNGGDVGMIWMIPCERKWAFTGDVFCGEWEG